MKRLNWKVRSIKRSIEKPDLFSLKLSVSGLESLEED